MEIDISNLETNSKSLSKQVINIDILCKSLQAQLNKEAAIKEALEQDMRQKHDELQNQVKEPEKERKEEKKKKKRIKKEEKRRETSFANFCFSVERAAI